MEHNDIIAELVIIMSFTIVSVFIFHKLKQSPLIGYFLAGLLIGPYGLELVYDVDHVNILAEIGVILLLFTIGLELSLKRILEIKRISIGGGLLQITITIAISMLITYILNFDFKSSLLIGCAVSLSSSAIVLKLWMENSQSESVHGRVSVGILIFQDIAVAPMMIILPSLFQETGSNIYIDLGIALLKAVGFLLIAVILIRFVMPLIIFQIAKTKNRELFAAIAIFFGLGAAWASSEVGLSLALGAFFAGLLLSESEYSEQIKGNITPFRDVFVSLFFISIGMLINITYIVDNILNILIIVLVVMFIKFVICFCITILFRYPVRNAFMVGLGLLQIGEFSLILLKLGFENSWISETIYQVLLSVSIITMLITPYMIKIGLFIYPKMIKFKRNTRWFLSEERLKMFKSAALVNDHVIIGGYGTTGQHLGRILSSNNVPFIALDVEAPRVKKLSKEGVSIFFGDTANASVLHSAGIHKAKCIIITVPDPGVLKSSISIAKQLNPKIYMIVRTKFLTEYEELLKLGVDEIVFEEFETVMEMGNRALRYLRVPRWEISKQMQLIRKEHYDLFRKHDEIEKDTYFSLVYDRIHDIYPEKIRISNKSKIVGKSLKELEFRNNYSVFIFAIIQNGQTHHIPKGECILDAGTELIVAGKNEDIIKLKNDCS